MLNYLWAGMILAGVLWGAMHGQLEAVTQGFLDAGAEAVNLCLTMAGVMALWTGILEVGKRAGLLDCLSRKMRPVLKFLFPGLDPDGEAARQISVNLIANMLGLGQAAAPAGLKAMKELKRIQLQDRQACPGTASNEMCTFLIINVSSLQLLPVTMIAYRSQYGSVSPAAIAGPALAATAVSTAAAVVFCKIMDRKSETIFRK